MRLSDFRSSPTHNTKPTKFSYWILIKPQNTKQKGWALSLLRSILNSFYSCMYGVTKPYAWQWNRFAFVSILVHELPYETAHRQTRECNDRINRTQFSSLYYVRVWFFFLRCCYFVWFLLSLHSHSMWFYRTFFVSVFPMIYIIYKCIRCKTVLYDGSIYYHYYQKLIRPVLLL